MVNLARAGASWSSCAVEKNGREGLRRSCLLHGVVRHSLVDAARELESRIAQGSSIAWHEVWADATLMV